MPLKDYICRDCGFQFEELVRYPHEAPESCSHCESKKLEELPSTFGGYRINGANGASSRPKHSGSFSGRKK